MFHLSEIWKREEVPKYVLRILQLPGIYNHASVLNKYKIWHISLKKKKRKENKPQSFSTYGIPFPAPIAELI